MSRFSPILRAIDLVESNLKTSLTVADMAEAAGCSLYHFCRTFGKVVHHTPYDYLIRRRLSESARELISTDQKIIDIALDYQFNNPETYSRAFKRMFGLQPQQWRKQGHLTWRSLRSKPTLAYLQHINQGSYLKPVFVEKEAFQIAGLMSRIKADRRETEPLWEVLDLELANQDVTDPTAYYGLAYYPENWEQTGFFYLAGVKTESINLTAPGLVRKEIAASAYARFIHKGSLKDLPLTLAYIYQTWLPQSGRQLACPLEIENYGLNFREADTQAAEIEIFIPVR
jgi:AraC family transcriptional regulator